MYASLPTMDEPVLKKKKKAVPVLDEETGGVFDIIESVSVWHVFKYALIVFVACMGIHYAITLGHVGYTKYNVVQRYREAAADEMNQDCCKIFYTKDTQVSVSPSTALVTVPKTGDTAIRPEQVQRCQRILNEEKRQGKANRCEVSQEILGHWMPYQVVLEMWKHYFPFADVSFTQYMVGGGMTFIANLLGGYVIRKVAF